MNKDDRGWLRGMELLKQQLELLGDDAWLLARSKVVGANHEDVYKWRELTGLDASASLAACVAACIAAHVAACVGMCVGSACGSEKAVLKAPADVLYSVSADG